MPPSLSAVWKAAPHRWYEAELHRRAAWDAAAVRRARIVTALGCVVAALVLRWSLTLPPGDPWFIPSTLVLAGVYLVAVAASRMPAVPPAGVAGGESTRPPTAFPPALRELGLGIAVGALLAGMFFVGAGVVSQLPPLEGPVRELLAHTKWGGLLPVLAVAVLNGVCEEVFFRGALYNAWAGRGALVRSTLAYTVVTLAAGVWLLGLAALTLGAVAAILRRATGRLIAPIAAHLTWSSLMICLLDPVLSLWRS